MTTPGIMDGASVVADPDSSDRSDYWNSYYATRGELTRPVPSQFAAFVAGELAGPHRIVELGIGSGRDAIFFASLGHDVVGVDASEAAIESSRQRAQAQGVPITLFASTIDDPTLVDRLRTASGPQLIYARFFIHAINEEEEAALLSLVADLASPGDRLAVEYRTVRDSSGPKVTGSHYRRFVNPTTFQARTLARGFDVEYAVEGFGFAKYKEDDAYVARAIFVRR